MSPLEATSAPKPSSSFGATVHFKAGGEKKIPVGNTPKTVDDAVIHGRAALLLKRDAAGASLWAGQCLGLACGEPRGPGETLRVVKWPLFHNGSSVYTVPPDLSIAFSPSGPGTQA